MPNLSCPDENTDDEAFASYFLNLYEDLQLKRPRLSRALSLSMYIYAYIDF